MKVYLISTNDLTLGACHCPQRILAQQEDRFRYIPRLQAYCWADSEGVPRRKDGDLFKWITCPFCGGDLP
jgi:hypothetical protein